MYASSYVFSKGFFIAWIILSIVWVWGTMLVAVLYPLIDGWSQLQLVYKGFVSKRASGKKQEDLYGLRDKSLASSMDRKG
jgi:hypothetical protein